MVSDPVFARAAGFSATLEKIPAGRKSYRIIGLAPDGKPSAPAYQSPAVDASIPTSPPPAPTMAKALSAVEGVSLFWTRAADLAAQATYTYFIERKTEDEPYIPVHAKPLLLAANVNPESPVFMDTQAPLEKLVEYRIFGADAFGRRSGPIEASVYHYDHAALEPPAGIKATGRPRPQRLGMESRGQSAAGKNPWSGARSLQRGHLPPYRRTGCLPEARALRTPTSRAA